MPTNVAPNGEGSRQRQAAQLRTEQEARSRESEHAEDTAETASEGTPPAHGGAGPVGAGAFVVKQGDCISSIAKDTGHFWETIWNDPANAELKAARANPNVLLAGDRLSVPARQSKREPGQTEARHRFVRRGEPAFLRVRIVRPVQDEPLDGERAQHPSGLPCAPLPQWRDEPLGNTPYTLDVDGRTVDGATDADGWVIRPIPGNARHARLSLRPAPAPGDAPAEGPLELTLDLGHLNPLSETSGVTQRLTNLGFLPERDPGQPPESGAVLAFQNRHNLPPTGAADAATRARLRELHQA